MKKQLKLMTGKRSEIIIESHENLDLFSEETLNADALKFGEFMVTDFSPLFAKIVINKYKELVESEIRSTAKAEIESIYTIEEIEEVLNVVLKRYKKLCMEQG